MSYTEYDQRRHQVVIARMGGAPAKSAAAWLSAIDKAERNLRPCPRWDELERIAPSIERTAERGTEP